MNRQSIPLSQRRGDIVIIAFFLINVLFITYTVDLEQIVIPNVAHFTYPIWPPHALVDLFHWYGRTFDPLIVARPVWWRATIWIDVLFFGPFYVFAIYAYIRGKEWIRIPSIIYSSVMMTNVIIILSEEFAGPNATPHPQIVLLENLPWLLFPIYIIYRMWRSPAPFTRPAQAITAPSHMEQDNMESGLEKA
ncbi:MAG TPA: emopamil-binding family protein [Ktedonobacteraceae bacterium]|nr:emopamil-binding family protein [Ktedonobacteraceae bacterium]